MNWIQIKQIINILLCVILAYGLFRKIINGIKERNVYEIISQISIYIAIAAFTIVIAIAIGGLLL